MKYVKSFGHFLYDLIVGDDWKIAAGVAVALTAVAVLVGEHDFGDHTLAVIGALLIAALFVVSLLVDVRLAERRAANRKE